MASGDCSSVWSGPSTSASGASTTQGDSSTIALSEAQASEISLNIFKDNLLEPLMDAIRYSIEEGQKTGEFRKDIDGSLAVDMLCGPIFFRLMAHAKDLDDGFRKVFPEEAVKVLSAKNAN